MRFGNGQAFIGLERRRPFVGTNPGPPTYFLAFSLAFGAPCGSWPAPEPPRSSSGKRCHRKAHEKGVVGEFLQALAFAKSRRG